MIISHWPNERLLTSTNIYFDSSVDLDTPVITLTPPSDTINETEGLTSKWFASGSETNIQYNWFFKGNTLVINNDTLQLNNIKRHQSGAYSCEASSTVGEKKLTRSNTTTITVTCKFFFLCFLFLQYIINWHNF